jgi:hypothetical protein
VIKQDDSTLRPDPNPPNGVNNQHSLAYDNRAPLWSWLGQERESAPRQQFPPIIRETTIARPGTAKDRRNGVLRRVTIDNEQLADFRKAIADKREVNNLIAALRGRRACYRSEVLAGDRESDPDFEYELAESERRLKARLKTIEQVLELAETLAREGGRVADDYRALLVDAGLEHRLTGTVPELAPIARIPEQKTDSKQASFFGRPILLLLLLTVLAGIILVEIFGSPI